MRAKGYLSALAGLIAVGLSAVAALAQPPSRPEVDAPELARLGPSPVGVRTLVLIHAGQPDVLAFDPAKGAAPLVDRRLTVDVWYPAIAASKARPAIYSAALPAEAPGQWARFTATGLALRDAPIAAGARHPLVILSPGYSNSPVMMSWLAENLASKGYIVAGIHHDDPPITDPSRFLGPVYNRPQDIAFVAAQLQADARRGGPGLARVIDPDRVALIGYSMGGYGVLTAAGAGLSPAGLAAAVPGGLMTPYLRGGPKAEALRVAGLKAVVALSPAGGGGAFTAWGAAGLADLHTPALIIVGDHDQVVGYAQSVKLIYDQAVNAPRSLLVFQGAGHSIGVDPAPPAMRGRLWDQDWFEDPVWRKARVIGVNLHMITAFLDLHVRGDHSREAYLTPATAQSDDGAWPIAKDAPYDAVSAGQPGVTVWKGFQRRHAANLSLYTAPPGP